MIAEKNGSHFSDFGLPDFFAKRGIIQVRSWAQQEGAGSRTGRSTPQLSSYMGQKAHREDR